jgi:hypothetical protein
MYDWGWSSRMELVDLIKYIFLASISSSTGFLILKSLYIRLYSVRPKILISIDNGSMSTDSDVYSNNYNYRFEYFLVFNNDSTHLARKITELKLPGSDNIKMSNQPYPSKLEPDEKIKIAFPLFTSVSKTIPKYSDVELKTLREKLLLENLDGLKLVISYESEKSKKFYTSFSITKLGCLSKIHLFKFRALNNITKK